MSHNAQALLDADPDLRRAIDTLRRTPGVVKIVCGSWSQAPHASAKGTIKVVREHSTHLDLRVYSRRGMMNAYAYSQDTTKLARDLQTGRQLPTNAATVATTHYDEPPATPANGTHAKPPAPASNGAAPKQLPILTGAPAAKPVTPMADIKTAPLVPNAKINGALVRITPEIAFSWLTRNTRNRNLRQAVVLRYAADMAAGRWLPGGAVIKFDVNGIIVNGQHTLNAVVESMATIDAYVLTGVAPEVAVVEDEHSPRSLADAVRIMTPGKPLSTSAAGTATMLRRSIHMALNNGSSSMPDITRQEEIAFVEKYRDAIDFACSCFSLGGPNQRRGILISPVTAVVARAYYTQPHEKLRRFAHVLQSGMVDDVSENAAVAMRNVLVAAIGTTAATAPVKAEVYRKVERSLRAFLDGETLKLIRPATEELFPLPEETHLQKRRRSATK